MDVIIFLNSISSDITNALKAENIQYKEEHFLPFNMH
jgi:hypothetical protein